MNRNVTTILFLVLILASVFAAASISSITTTTANGSYDANEIIPIKIDFNEAVDVSSPVLTMNTTGIATYVGVTGATLSFNYTVAAGQNTSKLQVTSLTGTITTVSDSNAADLSISTNLSGTIVIDTTTPTISYTGDLFTNEEEPELKYDISSDTKKIYLTCDASEGWAEYTTSTISTFDITADDYGCDALEDDKIEYVTIYAKVEDQAGNVSSNISTKIGYDVVEPDQYSKNSFEITAADEMIIINWNNVEMDEDDYDDDKDFIAYKMKVYLDGDLEKELDLEYNINYDDSDDDTDDDDEGEIKLKNLENGESYDLEIVILDKAGNDATFEFDNVEPQGNIATIKITPEVTYAKSGDKITATCTFSQSNTNDAVLSYKYSGPNTEEKEIDSGDDSVDGSVTISTTDHSRITFYCTGNDAEGDSEFITIDNNKPTIEWKDTNNLFTGIRKLEIYAKDNLLLSQVEIDLNNSLTKLTNKNTQGYYTYDLNSLAYPNGNFTLKAIATDGAGNKTEITRTVTMDNYVSPQELAKKAISQAKEKQRTAIDLVNYYASQGLVLPSDLNTKKINADNLLAQAESELTSQPSKAEIDATSAANSFQEFNTSATIQVKESKTYIADLNSSIDILQKYGLSAEEANNQISTMQSTGITRKLIIVQSGSSTNRQIKIEISFTNDTNSDTIKIVEVVPKELIDSARKIVSDTDFRIIKDDPVIEFTVNAAKGSTTTISYGIGEMDSIKAQEMIDKNVINYYETAPIVLQGELTTEISLKNLSQGNEFLLLIVVLLLVIVIVAGIIMFFKFKAPGHGFGEEKTIIEHVTSKEKEAPKKKFEAFKK